jgi:hypothetical protein
MRQMDGPSARHHLQYKTNKARTAHQTKSLQREVAPMRQIVIETEADFDRPVDLNAIQEAGAKWDGENIEPSFTLALSGHFEILRAPITPQQAKLLLGRLQSALENSDQ